MAAKTPTELLELIKQLEKQWELLRAQVGAHDKEIELQRPEVSQFRERLTKFESLLAVIDPATLVRKIATLEEQVAELKKWREEKDRRWWQFWVGAGLVGVTFVANLVIQFILLFARKPG